MKPLLIYSQKVDLNCIST